MFCKKSPLPSETSLVEQVWICLTVFVTPTKVKQHVTSPKQNRPPTEELKQQGFKSRLTTVFSVPFLKGPLGPASAVLADAAVKGPDSSPGKRPLAA